MEDEKSKRSFKTIDVIVIGVIAAILGALCMFLLNKFIFNNDVVMSIKGYKVTKNDLYEKMKTNYALNYALKEIDNKILEEKYPLTDEMRAEIEEEAKGYISSYKTYGYTQEAFLEMYGFKTYEDFIKDLTNSYRQELYYTDYVGNILGEDAIKEYYNEEGNIYGDINCKHILVKTSDEVTEEQAKKTAQTIISELDSGKSWDEVVEKYVDDETIITEDLGYQGFDNNLEASFWEVVLSTSNNSYSTEPAQTSYGFHVIYRLDQKEKPIYEKARKAIINKLSSDLDDSVLYNAFSDLEKEYNLKINDKDLKKQYDETISNLTK